MARRMRLCTQRFHSAELGVGMWQFNRLNRLPVASALLFAVIVAAGCGGGNPLGRRPVHGKVTLNGQPVDFGSIQFMPLDLDHGVASGAMIENGQYRIAELDGLPPGQYKVMISAPDRSRQEKLEGPPGDERTIAVDRIPAKYNLNTTLQIEVTKGRGSYEASFDLQ